MENQSTDLKQFYDDMKDMLDSTSLVTARMIDSILTNSQLASTTTPEMQDLFHSWINCISGEVKRKLLDVDNSSDSNLENIANEIGINRTTLLSLALYLHRKGDISIEGLNVKQGKGSNTEICHENK